MTNAGTTGVSAETARRLACDCALINVVEDEHGNVLDIGRRTRTISTAIRRALRIRDQHKCAFPGCTHELFLDAHHIEHWIDGGKTALTNLIQLCRRHHTFVHEHGYTIAIDAENRRRFIALDGVPLPSVPAPPTAPSNAIEALAEHHATAGLDLDSIALMPQHWNGDPTDLDQVIHVLAAKTLGDVPHETASRSISEVDDIDDGCPLGIDVWLSDR